MLTLPATSPFDITGTNPVIPFTLDPGQTMDFDLALTSHSNNSLLLIFKDQANNLLQNVNVTITDNILFQENNTTGLVDTPDFGQVFFANLENKTYTVDAVITGFLPFNGNFQVTGQSVEEIVLTPE